MSAESIAEYQKRIASLERRLERYERLVAEVWEAVFRGGIPSVVRQRVLRMLEKDTLEDDA